MEQRDKEKKERTKLEKKGKKKCLGSHFSLHIVHPRAESLYRMN
jgi:hypothetical protein